MSVTAKASAVKSLGEFKPQIKFSDGTTRIVEQSEERRDHYTRHGIVRGNKYARGTTYATREEATSAAQRYMDVQREDAERRLALYTSQGRPESFLDKLRAEIKFWKGE